MAFRLPARVLVAALLVAGAALGLAAQQAPPASQPTFRSGVTAVTTFERAMVTLVNS